MQARLRYQFQQRHAAAVVVDDGRILQMVHAGSVFLQMDIMNIHRQDPAFKRDIHVAVDTDRHGELGQLVTLRQIRIEVILTVKQHVFRNPAVQHHGHLDGILDTLLVGGRHRAREGQVNRVDIRVGQLGIGIAGR